METILFISAGMLNPKKRDHLLARRQIYLNYGALTLATQLKRNQFSPHLIHGNHIDPEIFIETLCNQGKLPSPIPVLLSIPSYFALSWSQKFCRSLKKKFPETKIVIGGRWVVNPDPKWLKTKIPEADLFVSGLGEALIDEVITPSHWAKMHSENGAVHSILNMNSVPSFSLDHKIIDDYQLFHPSIEVSRGCGQGCGFCVERDIPLSQLRSPELVAEHVNDIIHQYGSDNIRPYFQSSFFVPNLRWAEKLQSELTKRDCAIKWRCETRVDCLIPETIELLAKGGLRVIDLGMETASPSQILRMKKARDPEKYLERASNVLKSCKANGVLVKVNILIYAGETHTTLNETISWLKEHAEFITGVSVGPLIIFGPPKQAGPLIREMEENNAIIVDYESANKNGITKIHPSKEISSNDAEELSLLISRMIMNHQSYYSLKSFSYYPRNFTYDQFLSDVQATNPELLPFDISTLSQS